MEDEWFNVLFLDIPGRCFQHGVGTSAEAMEFGRAADGGFCVLKVISVGRFSRLSARCCIELALCSNFTIPNCLSVRYLSINYSQFHEMEMM